MILFHNKKGFYGDAKSRHRSLFIFAFRGEEKMMQNGQTEPRLAVGYPKAYKSTS